VSLPWFQLEFNFTYELFLVQFWVSWVLAIIVVIAFCGNLSEIALHNYHATSETAPKLLHYFFRFLAWPCSTIFFIPIVRTLLVPFDCTSENGGYTWDQASHSGYVSPGESAECYEGELYTLACAAGSVLPLFVVIVLRLAPVSGDLDQLEHLSQRSQENRCAVAVKFVPRVLRKRLFGSWRNDELVNLGIFTRDTSNAWKFQVVTYAAKALLCVFFVVWTTRIVVLATAYFLIAFGLMLSSYFTPQYQSRELNTLMFNLRVVVTFTCAIGLAVALVDDPDEHTPTVIWFLGAAALVGYICWKLHKEPICLRKQATEDEEEEEEAPEEVAPAAAKEDVPAAKEVVHAASEAAKDVAAAADVNVTAAKEAAKEAALIPPAADEDAPAAKDVAPAAQEAAPAVKEAAPAAQEAAPAAQEAAPAAKEAAPAVNEAAPAPKEAAPAVNEAAPAPKEAAPAAQEAAPAAKEAAPAVKEAAPAAKEAATKDAHAAREDAPTANEAAKKVASAETSEHQTKQEGGSRPQSATIEAAAEAPTAAEDAVQKQVELEQVALEIKQDVKQRYFKMLDLKVEPGSKASLWNTWRDPQFRKSTFNKSAAFKTEHLQDMLVSLVN
jgi:hypothetical protein